MSKCIIQIKIGDQIITLDPNSNISPNSNEFLVNTLDVNKLKALYSNIKDSSDFESNLSSDPGLVSQGSAIYDAVADEASSKGEFVSPIAALTMVNTDQEKRAVAAFIGSLPSDEILTHGNFLLDMKDAYKLSPYSQDDIRNLVFGGNKLQIHLYNQLISIPGLETLRISIAQSDKIRDISIDKPKGAYLRPDNIIQVLVPDNPTYYTHGVNDGSGIVKANLTKQGLKEIRDTILHELTHAVFSEVYISNPSFRSSIGELHNKFKSFLREQNKVEESALRQVYSDIHEFLADIFVNRNLQAALNEMMSQDRIFESLGRKPLYRYLMETLPKKYSDKDSVLKDALSIMTDSLPTGAITDSFESQIIDYVDPSDKHNLFFMHPGVTFDRTDLEMSPNDMYDSYWSVNAKAYRTQKAYLDRVTYDKDSGKVSLKDAHYEENIDSPTQYQIDRLYAQDLVLIPWLRYDKIDGAKSGKWIEQGVLTRKGVPVIENNKLKVVDILRDKDGKIKQPEDGIIEERFRHVPVMYSNVKKGTVVVAKVGLEPETQKADYAGYNTLSIPYELVKGIRKYNWRYFDHNHDYEADLKEANANLISSDNYKNGVESKFDRTKLFQKQIDRLIGTEGKEGYIQKAARITSELEQLYKDYTFNYSVTDGESKEYFKNITREDYDLLPYSTKNVGSSTFADEDTAVFVAKKYKDGYFAAPNPRRFQEFWQDDSGKDFAKTSKIIAEAVTMGDMVRIHKTEKIDGETVNRYDWLPVYQRVANGVVVGTKNGRGLIVSFNNIDSYAKNIRTESWANLLLKQKDAIDSFEDNYYLPKEEGAKYSKTNTENIKFSVLQFNEDYWERDGDADESEALTRFTKHLNDNVLPMIKPNESFVKVKRKFIDMEKKSHEYQSLELVIAKSDTGLITLRETSTGNFKIDTIKFSDTLDENENYGKELMFLVEDMSEAKALYQDYLDEKAKFEANEDKDTWENTGTKDNPVWNKVLDSKVDPRKLRDWYDLYDNVSARSISKLVKGDVVAIATKSTDAKVPYYFRKVLRVLENGKIAVVENRQEGFKYKDGTYGKAGLFVRYVEMKDLIKVGYRMGGIEGNKETGFTAEFHQDIIDRRQKLVEYAESDFDYNDFKFFTADSAARFNNSKFEKSGKYKKAIPLTSKILDPKSEGEPVYLDRELNAVDSPDKAAWVQAWFDGNILSGVIRGVNANSKFFKASDIVDTSGKYPKFKAIITDSLMPGDWVVSTYKNKKGELKQWSSLIDRIENGNIYTINNDLSTRMVNFKKLVGVRTSVRNDVNNGKFEKWKRADVLYKLLTKGENSTKASIDMPFKSPKDSRRALYEIGNRLQALNPDVKLNYVEEEDVSRILKDTGFDYSEVRAFVKDAEVFINTDKASVSDVVHEYAHLFLHSLKYDNNELYNNIISRAKESPKYDEIARNYGHLSLESDINEEVFVTLLGEYMKGSLDSRTQAKMDTDKEVIANFSEYTNQKLQQLLGSTNDITDIDPMKILNMRLEDVIALVGDKVINSRINSFEEPPLLEFNRDVQALMKDLKKKGLLTEECYG